MNNRRARIDKQRRKLKSASKYLIDGMVDGIKAKYGDVYDAAYTLGQKAITRKKEKNDGDSKEM